ncbi:putative late blight resistance protein homolog R1B-12 [Solanum tuberosum]|uniref:putative late blight resistance protein homolog R1B-12 n=1 Tax=Solanum tuberosum TaxID=4113 RepID=UPI00073A2948|nr:PREDICTED: putative late blight resistance protein homolog R1B-12 [Solanum tuberosum]
MVTTRIEQVAKHLQHHSDPYSLSFLTSKKSWKLLEKKVFRGESCPPDLLEAGLQVAQHCKGLPIVVVLIAGIIAKMGREASLWLEVANDLSSPAFEEQSIKVIQSSYDQLEDHLKPCLLYMGLFPEDHRIPVDDLLKLWMAEEFVLNAGTENMEEACRVCLSDLHNRSLVMVSRMRINRDVEYCSPHDVVREFCLRKLTEDKYMQLAVPYNPYQHLHSMESRLCIYIHDDLVKQLDHSEYQLDRIPMLDFKETNSLEFIAHPKLNIWNNLYSNPLDLVVKLRYVRALHLMDVELPNSWPTAMQSLSQLRYLALYVKQFDLKWISHLHDLQTLRVRSNIFEDLHLRAATLYEMRKLRHVKISHFSLVWEDNDEGSFEECSTTMLENMKTFHTCHILLDNRNPRFWWRFPNLEELSFCINGLPSCSLFPFLQVHTHLRSLFVQLPDYIFWDTYGWERYFVFPPNLRHLCLAGCFLTEEMILNIARLKKLETLRLEMGFRWTRRGGYCWDITNVEFPALKYLTLFSMQIDEWKASDDSFPVLEELSIESAHYFKEIPPSFATLRLIQLTNCIDSLGV